MSFPQFFKNFKDDQLKGSRFKFGPTQKFAKPVLTSHDYGWEKPSHVKTPREMDNDPNHHPLNASAITKTADLQILGPRRNGLEIVLAYTNKSAAEQPASS